MSSRAHRIAALACVLLVTCAISPATLARADAHPSAAAPASAPLIAILCYHEVSDDPRAPLQTVSGAFLRAQIRACRSAGWTFLSLHDLLDRRAHPEQLPRRVMVLTFDDGYESFRDKALPILRDEGVPATIAVITSFVDKPPPDLPPLMTWEELRMVAAYGIEIASHSHDLHRYVTSNPFRDTAPSVATRRYLAPENRYENREEYRSRIDADLLASQRTLSAHLGRAADVLVWPYGAHNEMARGIAEREGFRATLALGNREVTLADLESGCLPRVMVTRNFRFAGGDLAWLRPSSPPVRAAQVDLDSLYDADSAVFRARVDRLVARVRALGATHVILQTCRDADGGGVLRETWCMNHQAPVHADAWSMVAAKLAQARLRVWARVPTMNLSWAWRQHPEWRIAPGSPSPLATAWPNRLSPDLPEARRAAIDFVTDLAVYLPLDGMLFDDDAGMSADERLALSGSAEPAQKARAIDELLADCRDAVRSWRPECVFARNVAAGVVESEGVDKTHAQDFDRIVRDNDMTVVMAYPPRSMTPSQTRKWISAIGRRAVERAMASRRAATVHGEPVAGALPDAARRADAAVLIKLPTYDWTAERWLTAETLGGMVGALRRQSVANFGLYPVTPDSGDLPARLLDGVATGELAESSAR